MCTLTPVWERSERTSSEHALYIPLTAKKEVSHRECAAHTHGVHTSLHRHSRTFTHSHIHTFTQSYTQRSRVSQWYTDPTDCTVPPHVCTASVSQTRSWETEGRVLPNPSCVPGLLRRLQRCGCRRPCLLSFSLRVFRLPVPFGGRYLVLVHSHGLARTADASDTPVYLFCYLFLRSFCSFFSLSLLFCSASVTVCCSASSSGSVPHARISECPMRALPTHSGPHFKSEPRRGEYDEFGLHHRSEEVILISACRTVSDARISEQQRCVEVHFVSLCLESSGSTIGDSECSCVHCFRATVLYGDPCAEQGPTHSGTRDSQSLTYGRRTGRGHTASNAADDL